MSGGGGHSAYSGDITESLVSRSSVLIEHFIGLDRAICACEFYQNNNSAIIAWLKFQEHHNWHKFHEIPLVQTVENWVLRFEEIGLVLDRFRSGRPGTS